VGELSKRIVELEQCVATVGANTTEYKQCIVKIDDDLAHFRTARARMAASIPGLPSAEAHAQTTTELAELDTNIVRIEGQRLQWEALMRTNRRKPRRKGYAVSRSSAPSATLRSPDYRTTESTKLRHLSHIFSRRSASALRNPWGRVRPGPLLFLRPSLVDPARHDGRRQRSVRVIAARLLSLWRPLTQATLHGRSLVRGRPSTWHSPTVRRLRESNPEPVHYKRKSSPPSPGRNG